jgi:hypothetical protein
LVFQNTPKFTDSPIIGAVSICNPWDLLSVTYRMKKLYDAAVLTDLKKFVRAHRHQLDLHPSLDTGLALGSANVQEFDTHVTCRLLGLDHWEDLYSASSSINDLAAVEVPLICLHARDDPMVPWSVVPFALARENHNVIVAIAPGGGHMGFAEGMRGAGRHGEVWADRAVVEMLEALLKETTGKSQPAASNTVDGSGSAAAAEAASSARGRAGQKPGTAGAQTAGSNKTAKRAPVKAKVQAKVQAKEQSKAKAKAKASAASASSSKSRSSASESASKSAPRSPPSRVTAAKAKSTRDRSSSRARR